MQHFAFCFEHSVTQTHNIKRRASSSLDTVAGCLRFYNSERYYRNTCIYFSKQQNESFSGNFKYNMKQEVLICVKVALNYIMNEAASALSL